MWEVYIRYRTPLHVQLSNEDDFYFVPRCNYEHCRRIRLPEVLSVEEQCQSPCHSRHAFGSCYLGDSILPVEVYRNLTTNSCDTLAVGY